MKLPHGMARWLIGLAAFLLTTSTLLAAEPDRKAWLEDWQKKNPQWRALHLSAPRPGQPAQVQTVDRRIARPDGHQRADPRDRLPASSSSRIRNWKAQGMNKEQARELAETCHKCGIRLIPLLNCLGHQSARGGPSALLKKYPEFDETPEIPASEQEHLLPRVVPLEPRRVHDRLRPLGRTDRRLRRRRLSRGHGRSLSDRQQELSPLRGQERGRTVRRRGQPLAPASGQGKRRGDADVGRPAAEIARVRQQVGGQPDRLAPGHRHGAQGHHHLRLALSAPGRLSFGALLPGKGLPRAAGDLPVPRCGAGLDPLVASRRQPSGCSASCSPAGRAAASACWQN